MKQVGKISPEQALERLETLCVKAERCRWELERKLRMWRVEPSEADEILNSLECRRFVDDARFARSFARDKFRFSMWGRRKIQAELRARRIGGDVIAQALEQIGDTDYKAAVCALVKRKYLQLDGEESYIRRSKVLRFAVSRGYEPDLVSAVLRRLESGAFD